MILESPAAGAVAAAPAPLPVHVFFLISRAEHARMWRRVVHLRPRLARSTIAAFERVGYPVTHGHPFLSLGTIEHGRFLSRIPFLIRAARKTLPHVAAADVCYAFSLDVLLLLFLFRTFTRSRARLVYEVADIHPALSGRGRRAALMRWMERFLVRRCSAVVLTSRAFGDGYFAQVQKMPRIPAVVIEHKVTLPRAVRERITFRRASPGTLTIGYLGLMKSPASFDILARLAEAGAGRIHVRLFGMFNRPLDAEQCRRRVEQSPWMTYGGPYQSPQQLEAVYTSVDMVWDAYCEGDNARWQRTTRFSESCFFKRPLLYNPDTEDGKLAARHGLGLPVSFADPEATIRAILAIDDADLRGWFANLEALPDAMVFYQREYDDLIRLLA